MDEYLSRVTENTHIGQILDYMGDGGLEIEAKKYGLKVETWKEEKGERDIEIQRGEWIQWPQTLLCAGPDAQT